MKLTLLSVVFILLTACSQQAVYDMIHERERQLCLEQGRSDCSRAESYNEYEQKRNEVIKP